MGYGDDIMATAEAERQHRALAADSRKAKFIFGNFLTKQAYWSPVYENNPVIVQLGVDGRQAEDVPNDTEVMVVADYPGHRPYIDYKNCTENSIAYNPNFRATPGFLYLTRAELKWARQALGEFAGPQGFALIEPHVKATFSTGNKDWGWDRWVKVAEGLKSRPRLVQVGPVPGAQPVLPGALFIATPTFREALAVLFLSRLFIGTDGGLHHAAAAMGKPAIVLWTGYSSPLLLGYPGHVNLDGGAASAALGQFPHGCGMRIKCQHCEAGKERIKVDEVISNIKRLVPPC